MSCAFLSAEVVLIVEVSSTHLDFDFIVDVVRHGGLGCADAGIRRQCAHDKVSELVTSKSKISEKHVKDAWALKARPARAGL